MGLGALGVFKINFIGLKVRRQDFGIALEVSRFRLLPVAEGVRVCLLLLVLIKGCYGLLPGFI